jgi:hypothetical protein
MFFLLALFVYTTIKNVALTSQAANTACTRPLGERQDCRGGSLRVFGQVCVAGSWFRQSSVVSSRPPVLLKGHNASRWAADAKNSSKGVVMRKQSIFILFAILLASCNSLAGKTQSPSATPSPIIVNSSTQAPSPTTATTWNTYTNAQVGFSIQYPSNWQEEDLPDEVAGTRHHIVLKGPEGAVELLWGTGFGGACPEGYQPIAVANGTLPACHTQREDGTELWSLSGQPLENTGFGGFVYTNDATPESRAVVLQVVSTLSFP